MLRLQWAKNNDDRDAAGNSLGYLTSSVALRDAVAAAGVEITDDADTALHFLHPANFEPIPNKRNILYCLAPGTRVLTADLRWIPIEDVVVGDELIAPDENLDRSCRMRRSHVLGISRLTAPRVRIVTDRGEVVCSAAHRWARTGRKGRWWVRADELRVGQKISYYAAPWEAGTSYDDGWMAGFLDGEGFCSNPANRGSSVGFVQNPGPTLDHALSILTKHGYRYSLSENKTQQRNGYVGSVGAYLRGPWAMLSALGRYRPSRLLPKANIIWEGKSASHKGTGRAEILSIEHLGEGPVCGLATSTATVVAEGMLSHNTMYEAWPVPPEFERGFCEADHVIVPSKFCLDLFSPALKAARKRAHVVPLGFDPQVWTYQLRQPPRDDSLRGPFVFLHCGAPNARKGGVRLANAWKLAGFAHCDDFLLYLKTTDENGPGKVVRLGNTIFDSRKLPRAELVELFHRAHCAVLPSTGEGWGLILQEALATGLPLITTKYGGQLDFVDESIAYFCTHTFDESVDILGWKHREAHADVGSLGRKMLEVLRDYPRALKKAARGALRMHSQFTWEHAGQKLKAVLEQIEQKRAA